MQSTTQISLFTIDTCVKRNKFNLPFRELFYEFINSPQFPLYNLPNKTEFEKSIEDALRYPKIYIDKINQWDFYFKEGRGQFEGMLNGDFCETSLSIKADISQTFAHYVCSNFSGRNGKEGMLAYWQYELGLLRS